MTAEKMESETS